MFIRMDLPSSSGKKGTHPYRAGSGWPSSSRDGNGASTGSNCIGTAHFYVKTKEDYTFRDAVIFKVSRF
jgi:hypothetical protein